MKILYVYGMAETKDIVHALAGLGYEVAEYPEQQDTAVLDHDKVDRMVDYVRQHEITHLMSIHLIYNLAAAAYKAAIKYVSVIWDAPYMKIFSPFGRMDNCWFTVFDKVDAARFLDHGTPHVLYQPLSVNEEDAAVWNRHSRKQLAGRFITDVSFVGSLYEDNLFDEQIKKIPDHLQGYADDIFRNAALQWDGVNRIYGKTGREILEQLKAANPDFQIRNRLDLDDIFYFEIMYLIRKVANIERTTVLSALADRFQVSLFTTSRIEEGKLNKNVKIKPPVLPGKDAAVVYAGSRINLNISLKGIEGGTPQRIMDIMGAGGFVMTNYCAETAELFAEDREIVMFRSLEELLDKTAYYLSHDKKRKKIARAGHDKVLKCYTYRKKLRKTMEWVEGETDAKQLKEQVNTLLHTHRYDEIKTLLLSYKDTTEHDNTLAAVCYLCTIYDQEKAAGQDTVFSKVDSVDELLERYTILKFYLRRIDFDVMDDSLDAFYQFLSQSRISSYELLRVIDFSVVHKEKVLRLIKDGPGADRESAGQRKAGQETQKEEEICFIICTNDHRMAEECIYYIDRLIVPEGIRLDILTVEEARSMTAGYNEAMQYSKAKYKVYLHHDTFIVNPDFIGDCLEIFRKDPQIGMIGNIGVRTMPDSGVMWDADRYGMVYEQHIYETELLSNAVADSGYLDVDAIDGFLMVTQYDVPWREDLFTGWDFYDCSQSMEFIRKGYRVVVPDMKAPWCVHDCGFIDLTNYEEERKKFIKEYMEKKEII